MPTILDLTGRVFTRLTVLSKAPNTHSRVAWVCRCVCGTERTVIGQNLTRGVTKSCGCLNAEARKQRSASALHRQREYTAWSNMMNRCYDPKNKAFNNYGARGITVCKRWHVFAHFFRDMGYAPSGLSLERRDNRRGYSPSNCYWADQYTQSRNRRNNVWFTVDGVRRTQADWAAATGISASLIRHRLRLGWSVRDACTRPVRNTSRVARLEQRVKEAAQ